ncbi:MAG TPA: CBS domain-containing protein, partial [Polyangiaceae bacterium]|nr:CBS domain-containing protein [Polyangiaceae bacterium]
MSDAGVAAEKRAEGIEYWVDLVHHRGPDEVVAALSAQADELIVQVLSEANPALADEILWSFDDARRKAILEAAPPAQREQWSKNHGYPEDSVGRLMEPPLAVLRPTQTVADTVERLRGIVKKALVTYGWVVDERGALVGVIVFRELLFASPEQRLEELMLKNPFTLAPELTLTDAMREALKRHFPVYPVCDASGRLLGVVRGQTLFEQQAFELSAQAGTMVGVEKEERLTTPWSRSLRFRHPWLQLNLLTAF